MARREYFDRQAETLLKFAKVTTDPEMAAGLVEARTEVAREGELSADGAQMD